MYQYSIAKHVVIYNSLYDNIMSNSVIFHPKYLKIVLNYCKFIANYRKFRILKAYT